jgi:hypothetical protein
MKYRMRYVYYDLGEQQEGTTAVVRLRGSSANVLLLDAQNFAYYRAGQKFAYAGGLSRRSPVRLEVPKDGHWYVVVDLGGYGGRVQAAVEVLNADGSPQEPDSERDFVEEETTSDEAPGAVGSGR